MRELFYVFRKNSSEKSFDIAFVHETIRETIRFFV